MGKPKDGNKVMVVVVVVLVAVTVVLQRSN